MVRAPWEITTDMFLSLEEAARLLAYVRAAAEREPSAATLIDRVVIEGLLFSGLRCSEFCALTVADVRLDPAAPRFVVRGKRDAREVHLPRHVAAFLRDYLRRLRPATIAADARRSDAQQPFVLSERGQRMDRTTLYRRVVRVLSECGFAERASVQLLRHTYGYLAYRLSGGNLLFVQRQLGHAHPMVTAIYAALVDEDYAAIADDLSLQSPPRKSRGAKSPPARTKRGPRSTSKKGDEHARR